MKSRSFALSMVTTLLLAACAQSAPMQPAASSPAASSNSPGVTIANPRAAAADSSTPFPAPPDGYRGLGGALMVNGALTVITPDMKTAMQRHDLDVGLLHGMAAGHAPDTLKVGESDCRNSVAAPDSAIVVQNLTDVSDEVAAGIACARLRHPGTHWLMSQLVTKGKGYLSQVTLADTAGSTVIVYTDINRMANQLIDELGG